MGAGGKEEAEVENIDDKRWIVLVEKKGGKEVELQEWDLVEEFFSRIQDPEEDDEGED